MQERSFNDLMRHAASQFEDFKKTETGIGHALKTVSTIATENKNALEDVVLPDETRIPTEAELEVMKNFAIEYKRCHKNASKREIRIATQNQFNIKIYK